MGGAGRLGESKQQWRRHGQQQQLQQRGRGSGVQRIAGDHLKRQRAEALSGTPLGASVQTNCTADVQRVSKKHACDLYGKYENTLSACISCLPKALYSGVLHD